MHIIPHTSQTPTFMLREEAAALYHQMTLCLGDACNYFAAVCHWLYIHRSRCSSHQDTMCVDKSFSHWSYVQLSIETLCFSR